jgi:hypothetical protein
MYMGYRRNNIVTFTSILREMLLPKATIYRQAKFRGRETATSFKTRAIPSHLTRAT